MPGFAVIATIIAMVKRSLWRQPSAELLARLGSASCQEYRRLKTELFRLNPTWASFIIAYGNRERYANDAAFNRVARDLCRRYEGLKPKEQAAIDQINGIELANALIAEAIESLWRAKRITKAIGDIATEATLIEVMRLKYVYPDYAELVGPPAAADFTDARHRDGTVERQLTLERKADLLLLGVFEWKGMYLTRLRATHPDIASGWLVFTDPDYTPDDWFGVYYRSFHRGLSKDPDRHSDQVTFMPELNRAARYLHDYLIECDADLGNRPPRTRFQRVRFQRVRFQDNNPYNCLPDNLVLVEKRGRRMRCGSCGIDTTAEESMVLSGQGKKLRCCLRCLKGLQAIEV